MQEKRSNTHIALHYFQRKGDYKLERLNDVVPKRRKQNVGGGQREKGESETIKPTGDCNHGGHTDYLKLTVRGKDSSGQKVKL